MAQSNDERLASLHNVLARKSKAYAKEHPELFEPQPPYTDEEYADILEADEEIACLWNSPEGQELLRESMDGTISPSEIIEQNRGE